MVIGAALFSTAFFALGGLYPGVAGGRGVGWGYKTHGDGWKLHPGKNGAHAAAPGALRGAEWRNFCHDEARNLRHNRLGLA
jgi:hypothetical protein